MPRHAGTLRLPQFQVCRDVLDVRMPGDEPPEEEADVPRDPHRAMERGLWTRWEQRTPGLNAVRQSLDNAAIPRWLAGIWTVVLSWPLQVWHRWRLNRTMRWYARRLTNAGLAARDFIQAATRLRTAGAEQQRLLRLNLLLEALFTDLSRAVEPSRFRPRRRRRLWPFVLLVPDLGGPRAAVVGQFLQAHRDLVGQGARPPLVIVVGQRDEPEGTDTGASPSVCLEQAATVLRHPGSRPANTPGPRRIVVLIQDGPEQPDVARWLALNAKATPPEVGAVRAHAGWALPALLLVILCSAGFAFRDHVPVIDFLWDDSDGSRITQPTPGRCGGTWREGKEIVGVDTEAKGCYFTGVKSQSLLRDLQDQIRRQNAAVKGTHRTVVFLAPLTADPYARSEQIVPAGVLQLQGAAAAQKMWNERAMVDHNTPMLKILVANTGFAFGAGETVADRVRKLAAKDSSVSAVIGITQSRQESVNAINRLGDSMPVIGASVTGDFMAQEARNFFHTQPTNERMAEAMVRRAVDLDSQKALIVYDSKDRYSHELRDSLARRLKAHGIAVEDPWFAQVPAPRPGNRNATALGLPDLAKRICALPADQGTTFYAARGTQLPKVLARVQDTCGGGGKTKSSPIPVIASDVNTLIEYQDVPEWARLHKYTAVDLYYISFSDRPVLHKPEGGSDYSTGGDSFRAAAAAIEQASAQSGGSASPSNVLQALRNHVTVQDGIAPDRAFTLPLSEEERAKRPLFLCLAPHSPHVDSHANCSRGGR
ncbi:ABC transporter substrate-binding protein [Streptomyces deserti]